MHMLVTNRWLPVNAFTDTENVSFKLETARSMMDTKSYIWRGRVSIHTFGASSLCCLYIAPVHYAVVVVVVVGNREKVLQSWNVIQAMVSKTWTTRTTFGGRARQRSLTNRAGRVGRRCRSIDRKVLRTKTPWLKVWPTKKSWPRF
jgi:hypothetical protein